MKIVTLSSKDIYGGAAKVAYRIHKSLLKQGVENLFVVNNKKSKDDEVITASSLQPPKSELRRLIERFILKRKEKDRIRKWDVHLSTRLDKVYMDLEISLLGNALEKLDFDLIQLHWVGESFVNFTEFENIKQPVVWTLHDCFAFTGICTYFESCDKYLTHCGDCPQLRSGYEKDYSYTIFEQKLARYKNIDFHIVCPSNWLAESARKSTLLGSYPITVIPNGVDTGFFFPIPKKDAKNALGIAHDKKLILFGGISVDRDTRKGGQFLFEALDKLKDISQGNSDDIELLVFGADSLKVDLPFKTTFLGYIDNEKFMRIAYSAADVTIVPSMYENLPTVIMESMACGTPVAAFNIGGNPDMVDHKVNGYLATPYESSDLAVGIKFCLESGNAAKLIQNARNKVLDNFKLEDITQRYIRLYNDILASDKSNK